MLKLKILFKFANEVKINILLACYIEKLLAINQFKACACIFSVNSIFYLSPVTCMYKRFSFLNPFVSSCLNTQY